MELGAEDFVIPLHSLELLVEVVVRGAHALAQVLLGLAQVGNLTLKLDDGVSLTEA